jgi:UDP-N-acetylmuramoyl-L-alanyl-D-glutamate--2,6-diaminopimelate ligase
VTGAAWLHRGPDVALERVVALLVVACPCALGLSVPLAMSIALLRAARAGVFIKNPDALDRVLTFAHEYAQGRVIVVFGCGGDRDRSKRPRMGEAAARLADVVFVTSDNPRTEAPEAIIEEIVAGIKKPFAPGAGHVRITDRREAIGAALASARGGDLVVIAGKGHEAYQILRDRTIPFDDRVVAREALTALGYGVPGAGPLPEDR